jgi:hypothetical protein
MMITGNGWWPDVSTPEGAALGIRGGSQAALITALFTGIVAATSIGFNEPIMRIDGWSLVDAALLAVVGWRLKRESRAWAIVGVAYWVLSIISRLMEGAGGFGILSIVILVFLLNGVRGTFAVAKQKKNGAFLEATPPEIPA